MATNAKPSLSAPSTVGRRLMPPSRMSGRSRASLNCRGVGQEEGLFERVVLEEPGARHLEPEPEGRGKGGREFGARRLATEEVHRVGERAPPGELERVEMAVLLEHPGDSDALVEPEPAGHPVGHVELRGDRDPAPCRLAHRRHDLAGEARPSLERPAPAVGAPVEPGTQERAQQVVVPEMDFDAVEARLDGGRRGRPVVPVDPGDVVLGGSPGAGTRCAEAPGRRQ